MENKNYEIPEEFLKEFDEIGWAFKEKTDSLFAFDSKIGNGVELIIVYEFKEYYTQDRKEMACALALDDHILLNKLFKYWGWI